MSVSSKDDVIVAPVSKHVLSDYSANIITSKLNMSLEHIQVCRTVEVKAQPKFITV